MRRDRAFRVVVLALFLWTASIPTGLPVVRAADGGDEPRPQVAAASGSGETSHYVDGQGIEVWGVYDGHDLDTYTYRSGSPIKFTIALDRDFGPVDPDGNPDATNELYGTISKLTLRVFDVDEDHAQPEIDTVWVNGIELIKHLSGANDQWSISTFDVPSSILRMRTTSNPDGTNEIEVHVDTENSGADAWAVEVDWAELRTGFPATQATTFLHGILGQPQPDGSNSISDAQDFFILRYPILTDRTANPTVPDDMTIQERAEAVVGEIQDLAIFSGAPRVNLVAHSLGGLVGRQLAWDHPHLVDDLVMMSTPNGGVLDAGLVCALITGLQASGGGGFFLPTQHQCGGADALHQMSESYVRDTFNKVVRDKLSTTYIALASNADERIPPESAEYLSRDNPDHPGLHETRPRYEVEHGALVQAGSPTFPNILCEPTMYPDAEVCGESVASPLSAPASARAKTLIQAQTATIPAGATSPIPLTFGGAPLATVEVAATSVDGLSATLSGATFSPGLLVGLVPSLSATMSSPVDGTLNVTNSGTAAVHLDVLTFTDSSRQLTAEAAIVPGTVTLSAALTEAGPTETVVARIVGDGGVVIREATLAPQGGGLYKASVAAPPPGMYAVAAEATGSAPRVAHNTLYVPAGGVSFGSGFSEATVGRGDGMIDQLVLAPMLTVTQNATYVVSADLRTPGGALVATAGTAATLSAGTHAVELAFEGESIWESGASGPYVLSNVVAAMRDTLGIEAEVASLGSTAAYSVLSFRHDPITFDVDAFGDAGIDTNGDGVFEELRVTSSVAVETPGTYAISARLLAPDGTEVSAFQTTDSMSSGSNALTLVFEGEQIGASGTDGPYTVADLSVYPIPSADTLGFLATAHLSAAYSAQQFGGRGPSPVWGWGDTDDGRLGLGSFEACGSADCSSPVQVHGLADVVAIEGGGSHNLALRADGTVWAWGSGFLGQLGNGTTSTSATPVHVGGLEGIIAIAAGGNHSLALDANGIVWRWGSLFQTTITTASPEQVLGLPAVVAIAGGGNHSLAVAADGSVWAWGYNSNGQLGNNSTTKSAAPVRVDLLSDVIDISAGRAHSMAVRGDGTTWTWGDNDSGQLGDGRTQDKKRPILVPGLAGIGDVAAGGSHSLALASDGSLWAWGLNLQGQLGDGTSVQRLDPVPVQGLAGIAEVETGNDHSVARATDGTLFGWGDNASGQIDNGNFTDRTSPAAMATDLPPVSQITTGESHTLVIVAPAP